MESMLSDRHNVRRPQAAPGCVLAGRGMVGGPRTDIASVIRTWVNEERYEVALLSTCGSPRCRDAWMAAPPRG